MARRLHTESKTRAVLDSIADLSFVVCCAIRLLPVLPIPSWLLIWAGIIVIIKIVNQISAWSIIPIAIVAVIATFAAIQEGYYIGTRREMGYCFTIEHNKEFTPTNIEIEYCEQVEEMGTDSSIIQFKKIPAVAKALCMKHYGPYDSFYESFTEAYTYLEE